MGLGSLPYPSPSEEAIRPPDLAFASSIPADPELPSLPGEDSRNRHRGEGCWGYIWHLSFLMTLTGCCHMPACSPHHPGAQPTLPAEEGDAQGGQTSDQDHGARKQQSLNQTQSVHPWALVPPTGRVFRGFVTHSLILSLLQQTPGVWPLGSNREVTEPRGALRGCGREATDLDTRGGGGELNQGSLA